MKIFLLIAFVSIYFLSTSTLAKNKELTMLISAMKAPTPIINDLKQLTDEIGSRMTGSAANIKSVDWALKKFKEAGVDARTENFVMPRAWSELSNNVKVFNDNISFSPNIVTMPFTSKTHENGLSAPLINMQKGDKTAFLQNKDIKGKWLLIETVLLTDESGVHGLFQEYLDAVDIEGSAFKRGAAGIVYMSSRPKNLLYRHLPSNGADNKLPIIVMERESALKAQRLLVKGHQLSLTAQLNISSELPYTADNVIAEIKGSTYPDEIVLISAHIDSFDLGTGALDNGSNVSLVIDIARQIKKLNIKPKRTIRFALFNGEEQGIYGSLGYTVLHANELDKHIMTTTIDLGTGKINGFYTNGRKEITAALNTVLEPVQDLGPFNHINEAVVGTDNYDFMMQGVANLVAAQGDANYASNYHAQSDTFDKVDQKQLKLNAAIIAALTLGYANIEEVTWQRQSSAEVVKMVEEFGIEASMKTFGLYESWRNNSRGIKH
jgi:hypothetical protein